VITECTRAVDEASYPAGDLRTELLKQRADPGQPVAVELGRGLIDGPGDVEVADYLAGDLVGQHVLDRRVVDQRLHGRHPPAGVGDLGAGPDADHSDRSQNAAHHDEHHGNGSPPAAPPASLASLLAAGPGHLGTAAFQLSSLVLAELVLGARSRLTAGTRHIHLRRLRTTTPVSLPR
jgi:hypothetical protein